MRHGHVKLIATSYAQPKPIRLVNPKVEPETFEGKVEELLSTLSAYLENIREEKSKGVAMMPGEVKIFVPHNGHDEFVAKIETFDDRGPAVILADLVKNMLLVNNLPIDSPSIVFQESNGSEVSFVCKTRTGINLSGVIRADRDKDSSGHPIKSVKWTSEEMGRLVKYDFDNIYPAEEAIIDYFYDGCFQLEGTAAEYLKICQGQEVVVIGAAPGPQK